MSTTVVASGSRKNIGAGSNCCHSDRRAHAVRRRSRLKKSRAAEAIRILIAACAVAFGHQSALAQNSPLHSTPIAANTDEIVVTAEKRSSTVQKTSISITAISGKDLQERGLTNVADALNEVPGVSFTSAGPGQTQFEIRGLSQSGGESPTIGFYLDETSITPPATSTNGKVAIDPNLYDLSRIEVLRGPQGTLYGAGAMGGTIKLVTNQPDLTGVRASGESLLSGTPGGGLNYGQNVMINLPFANSRAAIRLVGTYAHTAGWIDRVVENDFPLPTHPDALGQYYGTTRGDVLAVPETKRYRNVNDETAKGIRATVLFKPTAPLAITASVFFQRIDQGGPSLYDSVPGKLAFYQPFDVAEPYSDRFLLASLVVHYDLGPVDVTSATGYLNRRSSTIQDNSESTQDGLNLPGYAIGNGGFGAVPVFEHDSTRQISEEVRLSSTTSGPFQWIVGFYYSDYKFVGETGASFPLILVLSGGVTDEFFHVLTPTTITQEAGFGNASYALTPQLKLSAGLRYFSYQNKIIAADSGLFYTGSSAANVTSGSASKNGFNPTATVSFSPTNRLLFYTTAARGFREGAGNLPIPTGSIGIGPQCLSDLQALGLQAAPTAFGPDSVWSYEAGEKAKLFGNHVTINSDVYYLKWSKTQQPVALQCGLAFTDNAADASVKGGEFEITANIGRSLTLVQSLGYSYAAYTSGSIETATIKGQKLLQVPDLTLNSSIEYTHRLDADRRIVARLSNSYTSSSYDLSYARNRLSPRDLVSMRLGYVANKMSAFLFVDNVLNRRFELSNTNLYAFNLPSYNRVATNQPRTIGLDLSYSF